MSDLNDPRVFFAAERTLLAWNRTCLALMAFGFMVERFGLFVHMLSTQPVMPLHRGFSFWIGLAFIGLGAITSLVAIIQYRLVLRTLKPVEIPKSYWANFGAVVNLIVAIFGIILIVYLFYDADAWSKI